MTTIEKRIINILTVALIIIGLTTVYLVAHPENAQRKFATPAFEENVVEGYPKIDVDAFHFQTAKISEDYSASICGKPEIENNSQINLYFTSPSNNKVWLRYIIYDSQGEELGGSGIIKPGEYLKSSKLNRELENEETIIVKVISHEPNTYYSCGSVNLQIKIEK